LNREVVKPPPKTKTKSKVLKFKKLKTKGMKSMPIISFKTKKLNHQRMC